MTSAANCRIDSTTKACGNATDIHPYEKVCGTGFLRKVPQSRGGVVRIANHGVLATDGFVGYRQARTVCRDAPATPRRAESANRYTRCAYRR